MWSTTLVLFFLIDSVENWVRLSWTYICFVGKFHVQIVVKRLSIYSKNYCCQTIFDYSALLFVLIAKIVFKNNNISNNTNTLKKYCAINYFLLWNEFSTSYLIELTLKNTNNECLMAMHIPNSMTIDQFCSRFNLDNSALWTNEHVCDASFQIDTAPLLIMFSML